MGDLDQLNKVWTETNETLGVDTEVSKRWWSTVLEKYGETQRHYHTMQHIQAMSKLLEDYKNKIQDVNAVHLAIVFHDIIYNPKAGDNEEKSAELFEDYAKDGELQDDLKRTVYDWIIETKKHTTPAHGLFKPEHISDLHYFLDMDMSVLGWPKPDYERYCGEIRQEYSHIPEMEFKSKRAQFLRSSVKVPYIFATPEFREKYEGPARENIRREIDKLTQEIAKESNPEAAD